MGSDVRMLDLSLQPLIGLVAMKTGRPAALAYTRNESMTSTTLWCAGSITATTALFSQVI